MRPRTSTLIPSTTAWMDDAKCRGSDINFHPGPADGDAARRAKAVCNGDDGNPECPVKATCLAWALTVGETGIWGGTSGKERQRMRRRLP